MKILVVDDSRTYQAILAAYLASMGYESVSAMNGKEALELFPQEWPSLILMDVNMPGMDGYDVARKIRDLGEEWAEWVPIIFLSSSIEDKDIVMGIEAGGDDYLSKPISEMVLKAKIRAMLRMADVRRRALDATQELAKVNEKLERLTRIDGLTGIANKRYFNEYLQHEWLRCTREKLPISLLFIDVDYFKFYNDNYGHLEGDVCLKKIAHALDESIYRISDMVFRYGGEEMAVILPDVEHHGMCHMGEVMVQAIRDLKLPHAFSSVTDVVTISTGGTTIVPEQEQHEDMLIRQADQCVYQAKAQGRNRFVAYCKNTRIMK